MRTNTAGSSTVYVSSASRTPVPPPMEFEAELVDASVVQLENRIHAANATRKLAEPAAKAEVLALPQPAAKPEWRWQGAVSAYRTAAHMVPSMSVREVA